MNPISQAHRGWRSRAADHLPGSGKPGRVRVGPALGRPHRVALNDRTAYAELACMSALAGWLTRWQPLAIDGAVLAGARMEAITGALGSSLQEAFDRWHEWALRQRDFIDGKPGITKEEYETVAHPFRRYGIKHPSCP
jgi:hypothetical protein